MQARQPVPIARVEALIVSVPAVGNAFAEGEEEALLVRVTDENGTYGIGDILVGADPIEARALFDRVCHGSFYHGHRGTFIQAMSAVDQGITALKVPVLFGSETSDKQIVDFVAKCRAMVGDDVVIALDMGYRWWDWHEAAWRLKRIEDYDIHFAEAPLRHDDLHGHSRLCAVSPIRVGGAEFAAGRWEVREWLETGGVSLVQPGVSRAGGFTELMRIADVANFHLQAAALTISMVEFRSSRLGPSRLRTELVTPPEPEIADGYAALPTGAGLGIEDLPEVVDAMVVDAMVVDAMVADGSVSVEFASGKVHRFHFQWLRHSCYCEACGNPADGIRFATVVSFSPDMTPESVAALGGDMAVVWSDGHESTYDNDWLVHHAYDGEAAIRRRSWRPTLWRSELGDRFPTASWQQAFDGGAGQLELYRTEALAALVGPIHETTVYGRIYDVRAESVARLGAKTGMPQAPHIDDAFSYSQPGIDLRNRGPLISLDEYGQPCGVRYFDRAMAPLDCAPEQVDAMYDAVRAFNARMLSDEFHGRWRQLARSWHPAEHDLFLPQGSANS